MTVEYVLYESGYIACMLATLAGAASLWLNRKRLPKVQPLLVSMLPFVALPSVWALVAPSLVYTPLRALTGFGLVGAYVTARSLPRNWVHWVLKYFGYIVAGVVILEAVAFQTRPTYLANPNMTASWLLLCLPWMGGMWGLALGGFGVLATQSRAAIAGLALAGLAALLTRSKLSSRVRVVILGVTAVITPWAAYLRWNTVADRMATWVLGLRMFTMKPIAGWGIGASVLWNKDHFDSALITIGVEQGMVGLAAFGVLLCGLVLVAWRSKSPARWALLALAIQNIVDDTWLWPVTAVLLGITLSLVEENNVNLSCVWSDLRGAVHHHLGYLFSKSKVAGGEGAEDDREGGT